MFIKQFKNDANERKGGSFGVLLVLPGNMLFGKSVISAALCAGTAATSD